MERWITSQTTEASAAVAAIALAGYFVVRFTRYLRSLQASHRHLQILMENATEGVLVLNDQRKIVLMNKVAADLISVTREGENYGQVALQYDALSPSGDPLLPADWPSSRALRGDFVQNHTLLYRDKRTGALGSRLMTTAPVATRKGEPGMVFISYRDDTPRHLLDEDRIRLADIVDSCDDAIIAKDLNGVVVSWNKGAEKIFGYSAKEMIGQPILRLIPADMHSEEADILARINRGDPVEHYNTTRLTKDGRTIHVSLTISPIRDVTGKVIGASKIARDITETHNLERQLRQSQKLEAVGQLTGGIAHDFNNLLAIILGNLELLTDEIQVEVPNREEGLKKIARAMRYASTARRAATRAADLTRRLLALSSKEQLNPTATNIEHSIRNVVDMARSALGPTISVSVDCEANLPQVFVDPSGLEAALLNLIVNARDAMPTGGALRIRARRVHLDDTHHLAAPNSLHSGPYARISVSDNGQGMSPETLERAFEPFFTTKAVGHGTGLGLAMVYGFLRQSNGTARIYSELGFGTTISLYLPFAVPVISSAASAESAPAPTPIPIHATILLVDDEPDILQVAIIYLNRLGYTTLQAKDGPTALQILAQNPNIDVMLTDIIMPGGLNGIELAQQAHALAPNLKVLFTSGYPSVDLTHNSVVLEEGTLLHKPYRLTELSTILHRNLNKTT